MIKIKIFTFIGVICLLSLNISVHSQWTKLNTTGNVPHVKNASAIYESSGNRMIVFGGRTISGISDEIWSLNLTNNQWTQLIPSGGPIPAPRYTQNAYYDPVSNAMIIWSGQGNAGNLFNDVWSYSFNTNQWSEQWPDSNVSGAPLKRYGTASVFEPATGKITTFAGFTTSGRFDDTWSFNVNTQEWFERTQTIHPPKRCLHSGVYANDLGKFVIYGGQDTGPLDDIWQCNLNNFEWSNITPAIKPPARFWNSIIYYSTSPLQRSPSDQPPLLRNKAFGLKGEGSSNIIIFGGLDNAARGDMWKFKLSNNTWESVNQGSVIPPARWGHTGIYIPAQDRMIISGGEGDSLYYDTWQYSNVSVIGIEPISNNIPGEYKLEQNYPNPFNPTTHFGFRIAEFGFVKLIIYDALGKVVQILVNQELRAGEYEIDFDGSNLSSGVYFYQLQADSFKQTKKMLLIK